MGSMPRSNDGSVDTRAVLRWPADVSGAGRDMAHRGAVDARRVRHRTRDGVRRNCQPTRVCTIDTAGRGACTGDAGAHADPRGSRGTWNSMTETSAAAGHDNADSISRRVTIRARTLERRDGADVGW